MNLIALNRRSATAAAAAAAVATRSTERRSGSVADEMLTEVHAATQSSAAHTEFKPIQRF